MDCQEPAESLASGVAAMSLEARDVMDALDWEMPPGLAAMAVSGDSAGCDGARSIAAADGGNGGAASALSASALEASALSASALNEAGAAGASDGKAICDEDGGDGPAQGGGGEAAGKPKRKLEDDEEMLSPSGRVPMPVTPFLKDSIPSWTMKSACTATRSSLWLE
eukprot:TRINITY_DN3652_c0_g1_i4.p2 TRINITY_DN3652_c0_g1~~TRINITY_DN3652_c0_g1_i4.p2  ORF type:complete len:167 (-),score=44.49 TRINITY_DN3652_c0_g1_i4:52-552(-)